MLKILFFLAFLNQKLALSNILNDIIFVIDKQYNLIFETALFTNCKPYIIFLFSETHWGEIEERETEEKRNKKLLKNNKEILFKWNGKKKNKSFDTGDIVKWCVIYYKIGFWNAKYYIFWHVW